MARKKKKHQEDPTEGLPDSSGEGPDVPDDGSGAGNAAACVHGRGSVNLRRVRQLLQRSPLRLDECDDCQDAGPDDIWVCLQCGHRGCGTKWPGRHAVCHAERTYSDSHALALSSQSMELWCYKCDRTVEASSQVVQIVGAIRKKLTTGKKKSPQSASARNSSSSSTEEPRAVEHDRPTDVSEVEVAVGTKDEPTLVSKPELTTVAGKWVTVKGLSNLGNTCYFNAVMQGPLEVKLPGPGFLTSALALFLREMRQGVPRPGQLFSRLCQAAPQFRGHHQHDSHELLRHLLEGVRSEEVKRHMQAVLNAFGLSSKVNPRQVGTDTKAKVQAYKKAVSRVSLDDIFGGLLLSTLICQQCGQISRREDPFQDLSLPIPEDKAPRNVHTGHCKRAKGKLGGRAAAGRAEALSGGGAADPTEADEEDNVSPDLASQVEVLRLEEAPGGVKEPPEGSLDACLRSFTAPELLAGANGLHCEGCGVARAAASLQLQVLQPPRVLTLHLKRFQQGSSLRKVQRHVAFPVELDLEPYCSGQAEGCKSYTLYGVVEHSGRMTGGHYVAYVRGAGGGWFYASDGRVAPAPQRKVLASQAYLLFYGRTDTLCQ
ncbi:hypothetical protein HPB47_021285 [Ixodes persulcatus]|uniref:Uncharacterized protein n=1 Tax=Ixodes persulcatus TaxID=34615 RepID=A0AC60QET2_IXOPE|nr:hypothetical protein HPB47_021285 [Ixodes persulcatus]